MADVGLLRASFLNLGEYDIVELRAVFSVVPDDFLLDSDGEKKRWREQLVKILKEQAAKEEEGALADKEKRNPSYFYNTPEGFEAQRQIFKVNGFLGFCWGSGSAHVIADQFFSCC